MLGFIQVKKQMRLASADRDKGRQGGQQHSNSLPRAGKQQVYGVRDNPSLGL